MRLAIPTVLLLAACSGGSGPGLSDGTGSSGAGALTLEITDKPLDHFFVLEAWVGIDGVSIHHTEAPNGEGSGWRDLDLPGGSIVFDLVELRNGLTRLLVDGVELPAGEYHKLRLHVDEARLLLVDGDQFTTEDGTLQLTSQDKSGFKVHIDPPLLVLDGGVSRFLLDVDLTKTFKPVPGNDPLGASKYHMHPVIRVVNRLATGEVHGVALGANGQGLESATVYALPPGKDNPADALASTGTDPAGRFALLGLPPGTYDLLGTWNALEGNLTGVEVAPGETVEVELVLD